MLLWDLFSTFFQIGAFTFGGGYAMIPMITDRVLDHGWLSMEQIIDFIAVAESTPGPFAVNISTFVGSTQGGILGSIAATLGVVLPSFLIIILISKYFMTFRQNQYVDWGLQGLRPAVAGLISAAVFSVATVAFLNVELSKLPTLALPQWFNLRNLFIFAILAVVNKIKKLHPIMIIVLSAGLGCLFYGVLGKI